MRQRLHSVGDMGSEPALYLRNAVAAEIYELVDKQPISMMDWDTKKLGKQHSVRRLELNSP